MLLSKMATEICCLASRPCGVRLMEACGGGEPRSGRIRSIGDLDVAADTGLLRVAGGVDPEANGAWPSRYTTPLSTSEMSAQVILHCEHSHRLLQNIFLCGWVERIRCLMADPDWNADKSRYPRYPFLKEHSIWAIYIYRFGRRLEDKPAFLRPILRIYYRIFQIMVETILGIGLPKEVVVGPGLKIWHFGGIFVHPNVVIGAMCTLRQGVTIGNVKEGGPVPVIGDNVELGAYAQIIGGVKIGDDAKIGVGAVVLDHVPARATVVGNPARIVHVRRIEPKPADEAPAAVQSQGTGVSP